MKGPHIETQERQRTRQKREGAPQTRRSQQRADTRLGATQPVRRAVRPKRRPLNHLPVPRPTRRPETRHRCLGTPTKRSAAAALHSNRTRHHRSQPALTNQPAQALKYLARASSDDHFHAFVTHSPWGSGGGSPLGCPISLYPPHEPRCNRAHRDTRSVVSSVGPSPVLNPFGCKLRLLAVVRSEVITSSINGQEGAKVTSNSSVCSFWKRVWRCPSSEWTLVSRSSIVPRSKSAGTSQ